MAKNSGDRTFCWGCLVVLPSRRTPQKLLGDVICSKYPIVNMLHRQHALARVCPHPDYLLLSLCDSGTSLCPGNGLVGVNKPQKKGSPKANQSPVPKIRVSHTPENNNQRKTNQTRKGLTRNLGRQQAARLVPTNLAAARGLFLPRDAVGRRRGSATPIRGATEPRILSQSGTG